MHLVELAVRSLKEAELCAEAKCYEAACIKAAVAIEAGLLSHVCIFEPEIRAAALWQEAKGHKRTPAPFGWSMDTLIRIAVRLGWLPTDAELSAAEPIAKLGGEVGDAIRFVQYARNAAAHPGRQAYGLEEFDQTGVDKDEYEVVYAVTRAVFDHLYANLPTGS